MCLFKVALGHVQLGIPPKFWLGDADASDAAAAGAAARAPPEAPNAPEAPEAPPVVRFAAPLRYLS